MLYCGLKGDYPQNLQTVFLSLNLVFGVGDVLIINHYKCPLMQPPPPIVQELCESRGGRPGLSVLTSLLVSVDVKIY